jgi:hypothetical protein
VNDEGYGYRDKGGEIWEVDSDDEGNKKKGKKKNKPDPHALNIMTFMKPESLDANKKKEM